MRPPIRGRGTSARPPGRFERHAIVPVDDGWTQEPFPESVATSVQADPTRSIITRNESPDIGFDQSINPYRGCEHGCVYCLSGDTSVLMGNGSQRALADLVVGDEIYGTAKVGHYRRYVRTTVLAHWRTNKPAHRIELANGTELIASAEHRFLTECGWKFVTAEGACGQRPYLTTNDKLMGIGAIDAIDGRQDSDAYRRGYLCGIIRVDGHLQTYRYARAGRVIGDQHRFRLAMIDTPALDRAAQLLFECGVSTHRFTFQKATSGRQRIDAIRTSARESVEEIGRLISWPDRQDAGFLRGFVAGAFDAEGSYSQGILRIANTNVRFVETLVAGLRRFAFDAVVDTARPRSDKPILYVRIRGGLGEHLRFFGIFEPAIARKTSFVGQAVKSSADLAVVAVEPLGKRCELFDITTGTGDFIANGVISHNCYARPSHAFVGLSPGLDFETRLFYKANAAQRFREEISRRGYSPKTIMLGANTDPYQPVEKRLQVTRSLLEVMVETRHPVAVVTKGVLVERDIDLLADLARDRLAMVTISLPTLNPALKRTLEPRAAAPLARLATMRRLAAAGIPVGALVAPVIPVLTDHEIEAILEAVATAGATWAGYVVLRLPYEVKDLFREWLQQHYPDTAAHVMSRVQAMRGGRDNDPCFGSRMKGQGVYADLLRQRFRSAARRFGLAVGYDYPLDTARFRTPVAIGPQLSLGL